MLKRHLDEAPMVNTRKKSVIQLAPSLSRACESTTVLYMRFSEFLKRKKDVKKRDFPTLQTFEREITRQSWVDAPSLCQAGFAYTLGNMSLLWLATLLLLAAAAAEAQAQERVIRKLNQERDKSGNRAYRMRTVHFFYS